MTEDNLFEEYCEAIFSRSNTFSPGEYEEHRLNYELNYGRLLPEHKDARILDVGCGAGHFLYFLQKKGYTNFSGIDISGQQVDFCRKYISPRVQVADALEFLKDKADCYDAIVANDLLEHIAKDKIIYFLSSVWRALDKGGMLMLKTPNLGNPFSLRIRYIDFTHSTGFTSKSLYQVLWVAGFRDIQVMPSRARSVSDRITAEAIYFVLRKLFWLQGFVAPDILTPVLIGAARK